MRTLTVWLHDAPVGTLTERSGRLEFSYEFDLTAGARLSLSMPVREASYEHEACSAFFGGLLPEGQVRTHLARRLGASVDNDFSLLEAVGGECAGAVSLLPPGETPPDPGGYDYDWLDEQQLRDLVAELPERPFSIGAGAEIRLSLAGVHDKLPVFVGPDGRFGLPRGGSPSSHIIKAPIANLRDTVLNECFCLALARRAGLPAVHAEPLVLAGQELLLVERYDRATVDGRIVRLHQEDTAQALGVASQAKYEAEGGPGIADIVRLLREHARVPARDIAAFIDAVVFNVLIGNADAHAKNYSLLLDAEGPRLAPLYDLLSTRVYSGLSRRLSMRIGGRDDSDYLDERHWDAMAKEAGLSAAATRRRVESVATRVGEQAALALRDFEEQGWESPTLSDIAGSTVRRSSRFLQAS
jgi:serine/threonine-protein kinase HipA